MGANTTTTIKANGSVADANEGGFGAVDISAYKGDVDFTIATVNTAGSSPTLAMKLQHSNLAAGSTYAVSDSTATGDVELREGATTNVKIAATWTQSGNAQIDNVVLVLKKNGTVTTTNLTLTIEGDTSGDPDGTAIGTATYSTDDVGTTYAGHIFQFSTPIEVTDATTYHLVLASDYTASPTNNIAWQQESGLVSGGNQTLFDNTNWAADADDSQVYIINQYQFADVTGGGFTGATTGSTAETLTLRVDELDAYVRVFSAVGGTSTPTYYSSVLARGWKDV